MRNRKTGYRKVSEAAGKVEIVAKGVKNTTEELDQKYGNDGHRATRADRSRGVIVRDRASFLPDIGARMFVDPLDFEKVLYTVDMSMQIGDPNANTLASGYIRDYIYPAYATAIIQGVKYDTSALLSESKFRTYHNDILQALAAYYYISYQKAYVSQSGAIHAGLMARDVEVFGPSTDETLKVMRNRLNNYYISPQLIQLMDWLFQIRPSGRTPNASMLQFTANGTLLNAADDDALAILLRTLITNITTDDAKVSSLLGKIQPDWQIQLPHYTDLNPIPELDYNWLNVWINFGMKAVSPIDNQPYNSLLYMLRNDNPNAICSALATVYDSTNTVWDPGLLVPKSTLTSNTYLLNATTGLNEDIARLSEHQLSALRFYDYENGGSPIFAPTADNESSTVLMNAIDMKPDTQSMVKFLYSLDTVQKSGLSSMRNLVTR